MKRLVTALAAGLVLAGMPALVLADNPGKGQQSQAGDRTQDGTGDQQKSQDRDGAGSGDAQQDRTQSRDC